MNNLKVMVIALTSLLHVRLGIQIPESEKFLLAESEIQDWGVKKQESCARESGIPITIGIQVPLKNNLESSTWNPESGIHSVESRVQDFLGSPYTGRNSRGDKWYNLFSTSLLSRSEKKHYSLRCRERACRSKPEKMTLVFHHWVYCQAIFLSIYSMESGFLKVS